jgi:hypothetical protein
MTAGDDPCGQPLALLGPFEELDEHGRDCGRLTPHRHAAARPLYQLPAAPLGVDAPVGMLSGMSASWNASIMNNQIVGAGMVRTRRPDTGSQTPIAIGFTSSTTSPAPISRPRCTSLVSQRPPEAMSESANTR